MIFNLYRDELIEVWVNRSISVEAKTKEEAIKIAQEYNSDKVIDWGTGEVLWDTEIVRKAQIYETNEDMNNAEIINYD